MRICRMEEKESRDNLLVSSYRIDRAIIIGLLNEIRDIFKRSRCHS